MTRFEGASWRPLAAAQGQAKMRAHDIVCLHTMVGSLTSTDRMFKANGWGGTESHFGVGGKWGDGLDGKIYQWQDTEYRADANLDGNARVISIETGDNAPARPSQIEPWTPKQLDALVAITAWACKTYDIPAVLIPDSKPGRRGIGYHRLGCEHSGGTHPAGFLQPGGERWSSSLGKECPGPARIAQIPGIVARVRAALAVRPAAESGDDEMQWGEQHKYTEADARALGDVKRKGEKYAVNVLARGYSPGMVRLRREQAAGFGALRASLAALAAAIKADEPLTAEEIEAAAERGARAALAELVDDQDDDAGDDVTPPTTGQ